MRFIIRMHASMQYAITSQRASQCKDSFVVAGAYRLENICDLASPKFCEAAYDIVILMRRQKNMQNRTSVVII